MSSYKAASLIKIRQIEGLEHREVFCESPRAPRDSVVTPRVTSPDQPASDQQARAEKRFAVPPASRFRFCRQVKGRASPARGQELDRLAPKVVHGGKVRRAFETGELAIDLGEQ